MDNITHILKDAQDPDDNVRLEAEAKLKQLEERNRPNFLLCLSAELSREASPPECRCLAGTILKNSVEGKYSEHNSILIKQWISLDPRIKTEIKESLLMTLGSSAPQARHASSQIIGRLAYIEIPSRGWQDLIGRLLGNMAQQGASPPPKQAILEALEYVFEEETLRFDKDTIDGVLDAVIRATSFQVRLVAVKALRNVHKFANFANDDDCRNRIMTAICDAAKSDEAAEVKHAGFGCLAAIASNYYMELEPYMEPYSALQLRLWTWKEFVEGNIKVADWRSRKTAISVLGVILEGPSIKKLAPGWLVDGRDGRLTHGALDKRLFTNEDFPRVMAALSKSGKDVPQVSKEVYGAIYFLARGYDQSISSEVDLSKKKISSELSPFLTGVIDALLSASELDKKTPLGLPASASAYGTLIEAVRVINIWDLEAVLAIIVLMHRIMRRLNTALDAKAISSDDKTNKHNLQALSCDVLHAIIEKLGNSLHADKVRESAPFMCLQFCRVLTCDCSTARDKAALAIGALARAVGPKFLDCMPIFLQYYSVKLFYPIYLEVICTIFHALGDEILPCCDYMMGVLYKGLSQPKLKPQILACFGEIALAIGKIFEDKYLQAVRKKLKEAANPRYYANVFDEDKVDYGIQLRQGICKAYSGILRGIKDPKSGLKVAADLVEFIEAVSKDQKRGGRVTYAAVDAWAQFGLTVESWKKGLISDLQR
ncbi:importin subunit beta-1 [Triticum aestivum]|nr:importin subunit beta-1-like [Triticum aestivum]